MTRVGRGEQRDVVAELRRGRRRAARRTAPTGRSAAAVCARRSVRARRSAVVRSRGRVGWSEEHRRLPAPRGLNGGRVGLQPLGRVASLGLDGRYGFVAHRRPDASTEPTSGARRSSPHPRDPGRPPSGRPGSIVRHPVHVPTDRMRHRHVLGGAGRRSGRQRRHRRRRALRRHPGDGGPAGAGIARRRHAGPRRRRRRRARSHRRGDHPARVRHLRRPRRRRACSPCWTPSSCRSIVVAHTVVAEPDAEPAVRARAGVRRSPTPSS